MTRFTKLHRKTYEEASGFQAKKLQVPSGEQKGHSGTKVDQVAGDQPSSNASSSPSSSRPQEKGQQEVDSSASGELAKKKRRIRHRAEAPTVEPTEATTTSQLPPNPRPNGKRRKKKSQNKDRQKICFACRRRGHAVQNCPTAAAQQQSTIDTGIPTCCYKCGSLEHSVSGCRVRTDPRNPYPFASCFICKQVGHLAGSCPENDRGVYPNGGCCKFCGSVRHLSKDCKPAKQEEGVTALGTMDPHQGGDDDDVFIALKNMQQDMEAKSKSQSRPSSVTIGSEKTIKQTADLPAHPPVAGLLHKKSAPKTVIF